MVPTILNLLLFHLATSNRWDETTINSTPKKERNQKYLKWVVFTTRTCICTGTTGSTNTSV
jgi:hypothetical protein